MERMRGGYLFMGAGICSANFDTRFKGPENFRAARLPSAKESLGLWVVSGHPHAKLFFGAAGARIPRDNLRGKFAAFWARVQAAQQIASISSRFYRGIKSFCFYRACSVRGSPPKQHRCYSKPHSPMNLCPPGCKT